MKGNTSVDAYLSLRDQVVALESQLRERDEALAEMRKCCSQRGARMQLMCQYMQSRASVGGRNHWGNFVRLRPEAAEWFNIDGTPK